MKFIKIILLELLLFSCNPVCEKDVKSVIWIPPISRLEEQFCKSVSFSNNYKTVFYLANMSNKIEKEFTRRNNLIKVKYYDFDFDEFYPRVLIDKINPDQLFFKRVSSNGMDWLIHYSKGYLFVSRDVMIL